MWRSERRSFLEKKQYRLEVAPAPLLLEDRNRTQEPSPSALMRVKEKTPFPLRFSNFFSLIISPQCKKNTIPGTATKKNSRCNNNHDDDDDDDLRHNSSKCEGAECTHAKKEARKMTTLPSVSSKHPSFSFIHQHCYSSISGHTPPARHVVVQGPFYPAWNSQRHNDANWQVQTPKGNNKVIKVTPPTESPEQL